MNKYFKNTIIISSILTISACANNQNNNSPAPKMLEYKIEQIESGTNMTVSAMIPMDIPNKSQTVVTNTTVFKVTNDVINYHNSTIYIPANALISGVYRNDGKTCVINWQSIYGNYRAMELRNGYSGVSRRIQATSCNPKTGIQPGDIINLTFN